MYYPYMIKPILPSKFYVRPFPFDRETAISILIAVACVCVAILVGWILTRVMRGKGMTTSLPANLVVPGVVALTAFLRFGLTVTAAQAVFLAFVLLYASCSDLTDHHMDDYLWVMVLALGLPSVLRMGIGSMLIGALMVFVPQMLVCIISKGKGLGGADIKLSTALAFLLGWERGLAALMLGLLIAVIVMAIIQKIKPKYKNKPFALIPFLSGAAMVMFFI